MSYESDFEQYESDFEDMEEEEGDKVQDGGGGDDPAKESILLQRVTAMEQLPQSIPVGARVGNIDSEKLFYDGKEQPVMELNGNIEDGDQVLLVENAKNNQLMVDLFMELAGSREGRKQVHTQTVGTDFTIGTQTEKMSTESRGTQYGYGSSATMEEKQLEKSKKTVKLEKEMMASKFGGQTGNTFVTIAGQLIYDLLAFSDKSIDKSVLQNNSNLSLSSRYSVFSLNALFKESRLCAMTVKDPHTIAIAIYVTNSDDLRAKRSFIAEFPLNGPGTQPQRLFSCEQEVVACCYSSRNNSVLFAGLREGNIVSWDLHGDGLPLASLLHINLKNGSLMPPVILPCFDSIFLASDYKNEGKRVVKFNHSKGNKIANDYHFSSSAIVAMEVLQGGGGGIGQTGKPTTEILAQLVTLNESGIVQWWTALDDSKTMGKSRRQQNENITSMDEGNGIKLVRLSLVQCFGNKKFDEFATCMTLLVGQEVDDQVLIGSSMGRIIRVNKTLTTKSGGGCAEYRRGTMDEEPEEITSLKVCTLERHIFTATTSRQRILLYNVAMFMPFRVLTLSNSTLYSLPLLFEWNPSNRGSALFYTVQDGQKVASWKMDTVTTTGRLAKEDSDFRIEFRAKILKNAVWRDNLENSFLALCLTNGEVHVHCLERTNDHAGMMKNFVGF